MTRRTRIAMLGVAVVILGVALIVLVGGGSSSSYTTGDPILTGSSVEKLRYKKGDTVQFRVKAPIDTEVHIHGYNIMKDVKNGVVTPFSFKATIDGIFVIEFEETSKQIAELRVDP